MSFIEGVKTGQTYAPGYFLANNEDVTRLTRQISEEDGNVVTVGDGKYVPMGSIYLDADGEPEGIVYEDVDVTSGDMPGSVVLSGTVYANRLPDGLDGETQAALEAKGFVFLDETEVERPY